MSILFYQLLPNAMIKVLLRSPLFLVMLSLLFAVTSCSGPKSETTETIATESSEVEGEMDDENTPEDKSERPSPPAKATATVGQLTISIDYSSPAVKGRTVWGGLVPYGDIWRTGANEASIFEVNQNVTVNGENLPAGKYALFTIPAQGEWIVIFNTVWDQWGSYNYEESKDALRIAMPAVNEAESKERLEFQIDDQGLVRFQWEKLSFSFSVKPA